MLRSFSASLFHRSQAVASKALFSTNSTFSVGPRAYNPETSPYLHHGARPRYRNPKFKNPRKRASKLFMELKQEAVAAAYERNQHILDVKFRVGDAVEIERISEGGSPKSAANQIERVRGVVLARYNRGVDTSILIRDVTGGLEIERKILLYSPMLKSLKVLAVNFPYKGRKRIRRAKLYYLSKLNPVCKLIIEFSVVFLFTVFNRY
jgi:large subunit ribosomal protein L19